jgi:hypothetical protein
MPLGKQKSCWGALIRRHSSLWLVRTGEAARYACIAQNLPGLLVSFLKSAMVNPSDREILQALKGQILILGGLIGLLGIMHIVNSSLFSGALIA